MGTLTTTGEFPKPSPRPRGKSKGLKAEKKRMGLEAAAIAFVQMKYGEYKYPEGARRQFNDDGTPDINGRELMRRAGYGPGSLDHYEDYLAVQDEFWELVELHDVRRTDPLFRKEKEDLLWKEIGNEALRNLYERVFYAPHSLSVEQHIKIVQLILGAGITMQKLGNDVQNRAADLVNSLPEDKRPKILDSIEKGLSDELHRVQAIRKAHSAADKEE